MSFFAALQDTVGVQGLAIGTTLHCFVYFQVNNGIWYFLGYVEDIAAVALSAFLQIFDPTF